MSGSKLLAGLWSASLSGAVIILAALLLRALFQSRTPRRVFCLLWEVALVRLLILTALPSPVSVWWWLPVISAPSTTQAADAAVTPLLSGSAVSVMEAAAGETYSLAALPVIPWHTVLSVGWLGVALALAGWFLWSHLRFRRFSADSLPWEDASLRGWLADHPLRRSIQIRTSDRILAPLTYGILRPVILLPVQIERAAIPFVLEHEYGHIRHFDTLTKACLAAAVCLHWFNPFAWVLYILMNRDMELACDEAVIEQGADRARYARTLLNLEEQRSRWGLFGSHFRVCFQIG